MGENLEIVGERLVYENKSFRRLKRWIKGIHPKLGQITWGLTGWETLIEIDAIKPMVTLTVLPVLEESEEKRTESLDLKNVA